VREEMSRFQAITHCEACNGQRLKPEALSVKVGGKNISEATELSIKAANKWFDELEKKLTKKQMEIAARILKEIRDRLMFLNNVGLDYLTLSRASGTLSGGKSAPGLPAFFMFWTSRRSDCTSATMSACSKR
jgi:excinuclease ABC subunit A